jgi:hypothetical protein
MRSFFKASSKIDHMTIQYSFASDYGILEVTASGEISLLDRASFVRSVIDDETMPSATPVLIDVSGITIAPTANDLNKMAYLVEMLACRFKSRIAYYIVTPGFVTLYVLAALSVREDRAIVRAFTDRAIAMTWLGS